MIDDFRCSLAVYYKELFQVVCQRNVQCNTEQAKQTDVIRNLWTVKDQPFHHLQKIKQENKQVNK